MPRGDCYEAAVTYLMDQGAFRKDSSLVMVHGEVSGQGPLHGVRYGHAWIEDGDMVIDTSNDRRLEMPKALYYAIGKVYPSFPPFKPNTHVYTPEQARKNLLKHKHYGPWDLKTSSGL